MHNVLSSGRSGPALCGYLVALSREAVDRGSVAAHPDSAPRAAHATSRRLKGEFGARRLDCTDRRRVRAYYYAVLRNSALERSRPADRAYRERLKVASLVDDLRAANVSDAHIRREVEAFFGRGALEHLPGAVAVS